MLIHERSGGIPRTVTVMCDNALLTGFGLGRQPVNYETVLEVANDLDLHAHRDHRDHDVEAAPPARDADAPVADNGMSDPIAFEATYGEAADNRAAHFQDTHERPVISLPKTRPRFSLFGSR